MVGNGWIKMHRDVIDWEWFKTPNMYHLFSFLLLSANVKDGKWQGYEIKRGQLITGRKKISEQTGISQQSIRTCLTRLKQTNEITVKSTSKFSVITICNYEKYQTTGSACQPTTNQQSTSNQPATNHKQEVKKLRSKEVKEKINKKEKFDPVKFRPDFIPKDLWFSLLENRKFKKLENSKLALTTICNALQKGIVAGFDIEECIGQYVSSKWTRFNHTWMKNDNRQQTFNRQISPREKRLADISAMNEWVREIEEAEKNGIATGHNTKSID